MYEPVNQCIYCGSTHSLSDEHIIPYALNGNLVLPKASCKSCADITKQFEQTVARTIYGTFRNKNQFRTRRKKERPNYIPVYTTGENGIQERIDVTVNDYPNIFLSIDAPPPGILENREPSDKNPELLISLKGNANEINDVMNTLEKDNIQIQHTFELGGFLSTARQNCALFRFCICKRP